MYCTYVRTIWYQKWYTCTVYSSMAYNTYVLYSSYTCTNHGTRVPLVPWYLEVPGTVPMVPMVLVLPFFFFFGSRTTSTTNATSASTATSTTTATSMSTATSTTTATTHACAMGLAMHDDALTLLLSRLSLVCLLLEFSRARLHQ